MENSAGTRQDASSTFLKAAQERLETGNFSAPPDLKAYYRKLVGLFAGKQFEEGISMEIIDEFQPSFPIPPKAYTAGLVRTKSYFPAWNRYSGFCMLTGLWILCICSISELS